VAADLLFLAGHRAYQRIRDGGLAADDVQMVVGASGAAKWLVLHGLETALFGQWFAGRKEPLHLYGTSIGSWKSAAAARRDPATGFSVLAQSYIHQYYQGRITPAQVARETGRIMHEFLGEDAGREALDHPYCRLHFSAVRCRGALASDLPHLEMAGLMLAWLANRFSRSLLRWFCLPTLFYDGRTPPPFLDSAEFPGGQVELTQVNFRQALLATASIPMVMRGVRGIPGATIGAYRDGGLYHYHPAFDFLGGGDGIVLYPHFFDHVTMGWLDKGRKSRIADGRMLDDVLLLAPSPQFVAKLPYGRIPDRKDFLRLQGRDAERVTFWNTAVAMSRQLGEEFLEVVEAGTIRARVQKIP